MRGDADAEREHAARAILLDQLDSAIQRQEFPRDHELLG
jgi:hypothetical protein